MSIDIPSGRPNRRFIRYVRPPLKDSDTEPLYPLRPSTRPLRLGIDVATIPEPPEDGYLSDYVTRDEIEIHLLIPQGKEPPAAWAQLLNEPVLDTVNFTTVAEAGRFADAAEFTVSTTRGEKYRAWSKARFFAMYQVLDEREAPLDAPLLTLDERHRAAAYAAAAGAVGIDAIVTTAPTAGRADVADNDICLSVNPEDAVPLIGHYLRVTANPIVNIERSSSVYGTMEMTESTRTMVNFYDWGTVSGMPYSDGTSKLVMVKGDIETAEALRSVRMRLLRAARALDHLLAALSTPLGGARNDDVAEAAAEAFDRELLYLAAAFDIYGRLYRALINPSTNRKKARGSLDSREFLKEHVRSQYDESLLPDVDRLQVYAWICKQLRNHIHDGILEIDPHPGRSYGNTMNVALNLAVIPELAPGEDNDMAQEHFDALGVWEADSLQPFGSPALVADLATAGFTLMRSAKEYVEAFTRLILLNKPAAPTAPNSLLGMFQINPGQTEPLPTRRGPAIGRCSAGILRACPDSSPTRSGQAVHGRWLLPVLRCRWCFMGQHSEAAPRTLESHLTHIYTNLGVSSRVQLAQQAVRHA